MDKYKKVLKKRIVLLTALILLVVCIGIYDVFFTTETIKESFIFGFQLGASLAIGIMSVALMVYYLKILADDKKLKLQYNKENDERLKTIRAKAGMPMLFISSVCMIVIGIIAGYFNPIIFITLVIVAAVQLLIGVVIKQIYLRKL
ncbi:MAG: hypothetical protein GX675_02970 [Erysipelotrichaceae bacterium]|nr:hypothetical protein [Erysipelotrichaceae bacterium]